MLYMEIHQTHPKRKMESSPEPDPLDPKTVEKNKRKLIKQVKHAIIFEFTC